MKKRPKVLCFIVQYPNFSETYMHEEIRNLRQDHDVRIVTYKDSIYPRNSPFEFDLIDYEEPCFVYGRLDRIDRTFTRANSLAFLEKIDRVIEEFQPDILHGHYFGMAVLLEHLANRHQIPFTIRTHSMDVLSEPRDKLEFLCALSNSFWCLGILAFPVFRKILLEHGLEPARLVECWTVIDFERFYRPHKKERSGKVMCAGPAIKKKAHSEFIDLATKMKDSGLDFDLYSKGYNLKETERYNRKRGNPVTIKYADPDEMQKVYPQYDWLVYTSDKKINKVGFPAAISEAQASGLGILWQELPGRKEQQLAFLAGGGMLFNNIDEVPEILSRPYPKETREKGFEAARRCDIREHRHLLADCWQTAETRLATINDTRPRVSIVITYFEKKETIVETVASALAQNYDNLEIILVDDCSSQAPAVQILPDEQLSQIKLIVNETNRGVSAARNIGIKASSGEYIVPLDGDDRLGPTFVTDCVRMAIERDTDCVYTDMQWFGESDYLMRPKINLLSLLCKKEGFSTFLYSRKAFEMTGGYREDLQVGSDHQFMIDVAAREFKFSYLPRALWYYRKSSQGLANLELKDRMGRLLTLNQPLYEKLWPKILTRLEAYYIDLLESHSLVENSYKRLDNEHRKIFAEYQKVLAEYNRLLEFGSGKNDRHFRAVKQLLNRSLKEQESDGSMRMRLRNHVKGLLESARISLLPESSEARRIIESGLFDENYYRRQCREQGIETGNAFKHFLDQGWRSGLSPSQLFDVPYYMQILAGRGIELTSNPLLHFLEEGAELGLPTSEFFDTAYYLRNNPDVHESGMNPLQHYISFGSIEGRETTDVSDRMGTTASGGQKPAATAELAPKIITSRTNSSKRYDIILGLHEASRTGAPLVGKALLEEFLRRGLEPLVVMQTSGELREEIIGLADVLDLSDYVDQVGSLDQLLRQHLKRGAIDSDTTVLLNSAELYALHPVFKPYEMRVVTLIHEFMSCYPGHIRNLVWKNSDVAIFSSRLVMEEAQALDELTCETTYLPQGLADESIGSLDRQTSRDFLLNRLDAENSDLIVLACGTAEMRKGIDLFVPIAAQILTEAPNARFVWIGGEHRSGAEALNWARQDAVRAHVDHRVHFLGQLDSIESYFAGADVFMLPSRLDPLPCVLQMAMACGMPVVAFEESGGAKDALAHGGGITVPYLNLTEMAEAIIAYSRDRSLLEDHGAQGRLSASRHYNFKRYADRILEYLKITRSATA